MRPPANSTAWTQTGSRLQQNATLRRRSPGPPSPADGISTHPMRGKDMRMNRRAVLAGVAAAAAAGTARLVHAQSWRGQYPELVYAVVPAENASGVVDRYAAFVDYL